jgi:hypothetical protein
LDVDKLFVCKSAVPPLRLDMLDVLFVDASVRDLWLIRRFGDFALKIGKFHLRLVAYT